MNPRRSTREPQAATSRGGVLASTGASVLFGAMFTMPPLLRPLDPQQILAYRIITMLVLLAVVISLLRAWGEVATILRRCRRRPILAVVVVADGALLGVQLWLFGWAPQTGHGLEVSLGYLILPLAMVIVSVVLFGERLSRLRIAAVASAGVGVAAAVVVAGGLGWPTLLVAGGYPVYFISRRTFALDTSGAQWLEIVAMLPFAAAVFTAWPSLGTVASSPTLALSVGLLGVLSAAGTTLYLTASRVLPFALFGLLSYVEPALLVLVSLTILEEPWSSTDAYVYGPITLGLAFLAIESTRGNRLPRRTHDRRRTRMTENPGIWSYQFRVISRSETSDRR